MLILTYSDGECCNTIGLIEEDFDLDKLKDFLINECKKDRWILPCRLEDKDLDNLDWNNTSIKISSEKEFFNYYSYRDITLTINFINELDEDTKEDIGSFLGINGIDENGNLYVNFELKKYQVLDI